MNKPRKEHILKTYGREPETMDELARCVIHMINSQENGDVFERRKRGEKKLYKVAGFAWDHNDEDMGTESIKKLLEYLGHTVTVEECY
jgi:hypothetical protein